MPKAALKGDPDEVLDQASKTRSIVVVGDIRRSQDLMTYAGAPGIFSGQIVNFINTTRELIEKHAGLFDKFTGDGFIAYFNDAICRIADRDFIECFIEFIKEETLFAGPFFANWAKTIIKMPGKGIGLAIGADIGNIVFKDLQNHLVSVGDAIVWAEMMATAATSNEVFVNNLLFVILENKPDISFEKHERETKTGENFLARSMKFINRLAREGSEEIKTGSS